MKNKKFPGTIHINEYPHSTSTKSKVHSSHNVWIPSQSGDSSADHAAQRMQKYSPYDHLHKLLPKGIKLPKHHTLSIVGGHNQVKESTGMKSFKQFIKESKIPGIAKDSDGNRILPRDDAMNGVHQVWKKYPPKVGDWHDFFHKKTGDKIYGQVSKYDGKHITFKENGRGKLHKFKIRYHD